MDQRARRRASYALAVALAWVLGALALLAESTEVFIVCATVIVVVLFIAYLDRKER